MKHEGVGISAKLGNNEWHPLRHQAGDKGHVARKAIELRNDYAAFRRLCCGQGGCQTRAPVQGVSALAGFDFDELGSNCERLGCGKALDGGPLGIKAKTRAPLSLRGNPEICNRPLHDQRAYHRMRFGRSAIESNDIALFMLQQRTQSSFCDVALQRVLSMYPMWQRLLAEGKDIACCSERGPTAISVARGRRSAPVRLDVSFGPLLHGQALCRHERNR